MEVSLGIVVIRQMGLEMDMGSCKAKMTRSVLIYRENTQNFKAHANQAILGTSPILKKAYAAGHNS